jgi:mannose-6-phosphate isomerase-like protein (cupin superfamily)
MKLSALLGRIARRTDDLAERTHPEAPMKHVSVSYAPGFHVLIGNDHSQAATMVIEPGDKEGGAENRHHGADQWLYVESGSGEARINGHSYTISAGSLILIQRGDRHEILNTGRSPLKTLNFYVPPAYKADGNELPPGKSS